MSSKHDISNFKASMILKVNFATCEQCRIFRKGSSEALIAAMPVDGKSNASDWGGNKSELSLYTLQFAGQILATSHDWFPLNAGKSRFVKYYSIWSN